MCLAFVSGHVRNLFVCVCVCVCLCAGLGKGGTGQYRAVCDGNDEIDAALPSVSHDSRDHAARPGWRLKAGDLTIDVMTGRSRVLGLSLDFRVLMRRVWSISNQSVSPSGTGLAPIRGPDCWNQHGTVYQVLVCLSVCVWNACVRNRSSYQLHTEERVRWSSDVWYSQYQWKFN